MEIYVSTDVEADGPIPGPNSMLSFASAAFTPDGTLVDTFEANLKQMRGAKPDRRTMKDFWARNLEAWNYCRKDPRRPKRVMTKYVKWINKLRQYGKPVFVAFPLGFDFMFIYWYLIKFTGQSPFSFFGLDIKTFAMFMMNTGYRQSIKRKMPKRWFSAKKHSHKAIDDAIEQGELFCNMYKEYQELYKENE